MADVSTRTASPTGRTTERRRPAKDTELAFISAATELFAKRGYNGTSISDLAKELGLTTASLYYHVRGKEDLLFRVLETGMFHFLESLEEIAEEETDSRTKLQRAIENHLDFVLHNQSAVAVFLRERRFLEDEHRKEHQARVDHYDRVFNELVEQAMADGEIPDGDARLVRLSILGMINWVVEWFNPSGAKSADDVRSSLTELIMDQMLARP